MSTYFYKHTYVHPILMNTFKKLSWFDLEIHEVSDQKCFTVDGDVISN
jgi:hypothetical protein